MNILSLLKKEVLWSRHRILALIFLLLLLPAFFAYTTVVFQHVVPKNTPIAIVPENESVTENDISVVKGGATLFAEPTVYEDKADAMRALQRESVYAVLQVPPDIFDNSTENATFYMYVDGSLVPFKEPSKAIGRIMQVRLNQNLPADVTIERRVVGEQQTLSEYLVPVFLLGFIMLFSFTYLPYNLAQEADVLERLLVEASLEEVILTKIAYFTALLLLPILAFSVTSIYLDYTVGLLSPGVVAVLLLTFIYLTSISISIMIITGFGTLGRFINVSMLFGMVAFSSLIYPVGFFSPLRREIARLIPLHYSMVIVRSLSLKDVTIALFLDQLALLLGFTVATGVLLKSSIEWYKQSL